MNRNTFNLALLPLAILLALGSTEVSAGVQVQCPGDKDGSAIIGDAPGESPNPDVVCMHLTAGDGYATMGDGSPKYIFSFADVTGMPTKTRSQKNAVVQAGMLAHEWPAPTIMLEQGQEFYLNLTNVGMVMRPDLFDPHSAHFHGFPESSTVYDGLPESGLSIGQGATLTYYYKLNDPGTYMYHCHVEATEHMQMGMLGNLYVRAAQNGTSYEYPLGSGKTYTQFAYNDEDGSTGYDVEYPIQLGSFDGAFHDASESTQPLPFALMVDDYPMINGRGYPDTADARTDTFPIPVGFNDTHVPTGQPVSSLITANAGDKVLLFWSLYPFGIKRWVESVSCTSVLLKIHSLTQTIVHRFQTGAEFSSFPIINPKPQCSPSPGDREFFPKQSSEKIERSANVAHYPNPILARRARLGDRRMLR